MTEKLAGEFLFVAFENDSDGEGFRVWTGEGDGLTAFKAEAAAIEFLKRIAEVEIQRTDSCADCPSCQTRLARVRAALAALGGPEGWQVTSPGPMERPH